MQFRHPPRRRPLSAAPKSCRMPRGRAQRCGSVRLAFSRPTAHPPPVVRADSISARGTLRRRGVRRDEGIPPYGRPGGDGQPFWPQRLPWFVGEGHGPPAAGGIAPPRNAAPGSGRQPQGNPPVSALAPLDKGAFCAAARFHTFSPKPKPRSNAKPVRRAGTVHNFFTKTAKKLFNFFQMYGKVESLEQTNGPGPPAVWTK